MLDGEEGIMKLVEGIANMGGDNVVSGKLSGRQPTMNTKQFKHGQDKDNHGNSYGSWMLVRRPKRGTRQSLVKGPSTSNKIGLEHNKFRLREGMCPDIAIVEGGNTKGSRSINVSKGKVD